eukprot:scaffold256933_cov28-Tisochrysis_lutea.AAC.1
MRRPESQNRLGVTRPQQRARSFSQRSDIAPRLATSIGKAGHHGTPYGTCSTPQAIPAPPPGFLAAKRWQAGSGPQGRAGRGRHPPAGAAAAPMGPCSRLPCAAPSHRSCPWSSGLLCAADCVQSSPSGTCKEEHLRRRTYAG